MRKVLKCWRQVHSTQIFRGRKSGFHKQSIYLFGIVVSEKMMKMDFEYLREEVVESAWAHMHSCNRLAPWIRVLAVASSTFSEKFENSC